MDLQAYLKAQEELKAKEAEKEKQEKLAKFKATQLSSKSSSASNPAKDDKKISTGGPTAQEQEQEIIHLRAQLATKYKEDAERTRILEQGREIARLKAELSTRDKKDSDVNTKDVPSASSGSSSSSSSISSSSSRAEELERQLAAMKAKLSAAKAPPAPVAKPEPSASAKREASLLQELEKYKALLSAAEVPAPLPSTKILKEKPSEKSGERVSDSAIREAKLKLEIEELNKSIGTGTVRDSESSTASTAAADSRLEALKREHDEIKRKLEASKDGASVVVSASAVRISDLEKEREMLKRKLEEGPSKSALTSARNTERVNLDKISYGVDVCFLVDCTGSMSPFIQAVKTKVTEIARQINSMEGYQRAYMRFAFVGYRDHCDGNQRIEKVDFVHEIPGSPFESTLRDCIADGGGDAPEDIAGGLEEATTLSWASSTRLIVHFADAPCHGSQYHSLPDSYPGGDPNGLIPENILRILISKRVEYYFMKINASTDRMSQIFAEVYNSVQKSFTIASIDAAASDFVPKVVNSIRSSMKRSYRR